MGTWKVVNGQRSGFIKDSKNMIQSNDMYGMGVARRQSTPLGVWCFKKCYNFFRDLNLFTISLVKNPFFSRCHVRVPPPLPVGHVEFIFHKINVKWWTLIFLLVLKWKIKYACRPNDNTISNATCWAKDENIFYFLKNKCSSESWSCSVFVGHKIDF